jgi:hypothetical protein
MAEQLTQEGPEHLKTRTLLNQDGEEGQNQAQQDE